MMRKTLSVLVTMLLATAMLISVSVPLQAAGTATAPQARNVIFLMSDGTSAGVKTLARWYDGGGPLALDEIAAGAVTTYSAESLITDSAPAATAFATGYISNTKLIGVRAKKTGIPGVDPIADEDTLMPVATVLEGARLAGKATGLIATSNIQHASPAAFSSHWPDRNNYTEIAEQQVYQNIDVVFSGGLQYLKPASDGGKRQDGEDMVKVLNGRGYSVITTPEEMRQAQAAKVWGLFAPDALAYEMDRDPAKEPSLADMTAKAIELLNRNSKGFFLFVEGSKVDWAAHSNDPVGVISDFRAFDDAVKVALDFAKQDGNTLVIATHDHGNGGISIGNAASNADYDTTPYADVLGPLLKARRTGEGLEKLFAKDFSNVESVMADYYGITDLTADEIAKIKATKPGKMNATVGPMISKRAKVGWTTTGHTGEDVFLYAYGPGKPTGTLHLTGLAEVMSSRLGFSLDDVNEALYVPVRAAFEAKGATVEWNTDDPANPVVVVTKGEVRAEFPVSKDIVRLNGAEQQMNGLTVFNGKRVFVPQAGIDLVLKALQ